MNSLEQLTHNPDWQQRLTHWKRRLLPVWARYWPLILIGSSLLWLGLEVYHQSLEEHLAQYYSVVNETHRPTTPVAPELATLPGRFASVNTHAYKRGLRAGALANLLIKLLLPYLLLLSAIGHYQYWYITRQVLLSPGKGGKWGYGLSLILVWLLLMGTTHPAFGKLAVRAGLADWFPGLTISYLVGYSMLLHFRERQREARELAQARQQAELNALKAQVNPPFLFHALQGLHETAVAENLPRTTQSLDQLAGIMQYVLEESRHQTTDVAREIGFIRDYLRLQQLRVPERDNIRITTDVDWDGKPACIVPLLLNPLIENAFKYGISIQHPCFVTIRFRVAAGMLVFVTENSILPKNDLELGTGLGLKNVRRRLALAYPDQHKLTVTERDGVYRVELKIKLT